MTATSSSGVPGPRRAALLRAVIALQRDPPGALLQLNRTYGDLIHLPLRSRSFYLAAHPRDVAHVLQDHHQNYDKRTRTFARMRELIGEGLITSDGDRWRRHRRMLQPAFHQQEVVNLAPVINRIVRERASSWQQITARSTVVDAGAEMTALALRIAGAALFGGDSHLPQDLDTSISTALDYTARRAERVIDWGHVPTRGRRRFRKALARLDSVAQALIEQRRAEPDDRYDLLAVLLNARDRDGVRLDDAELRDQVLTLLLAGHETIATALTWTLHLLAHHEEAQARLRAEVREHLSDDEARLTDLTQLSWTRAVLHEAMRLYPPVWLMERRARAEDELGGHLIPAGATVALSQYITHRHPAFWVDPERFDPTRFLAAPGTGVQRYAWFPFGGGPRGCIGGGLAMLEAQIILATLARDYVFEPLTPRQVRTRAGITLRPREPLLLLISRAS